MEIKQSKISHIIIFLLHDLTSVLLNYNKYSIIFSREFAQKERINRHIFIQKDYIISYQFISRKQFSAHCWLKRNFPLEFLFPFNFHLSTNKKTNMENLAGR